MNRLEFVKKSFLMTAGGVIALPSFAGGVELRSSRSITILHTNDTHSRIDPFPPNAVEHGGLGGVSRRASLVDRIRAHSPNTLLLDAGDAFHNTPWFRQFGGEKVFELMSRIGYDAMCLGDYEFIDGLQGFADAAVAASFPILCANYRIDQTPLYPHVRPFMVKELGRFRIGIFGLGIELEGNVSPENYGDVRVEDPVRWAEAVVSSLKHQQQCDYIICLSHLGYRYDDDRIDDLTLAARTEGIDLIIGGHTHTFLDKPVQVNGLNGSRTLVAQAGHSGIRLGRIDLGLTNSGEIREVISHHYTLHQEEAAEAV